MTTDPTPKTISKWFVSTVRSRDKSHYFQIILGECDGKIIRTSSIVELLGCVVLERKPPIPQWNVRTHSGSLYTLSGYPIWGPPPTSPHSLKVH